MNYKTLIRLSTSVFVSALLISFLYWRSTIGTNQKNNFKRLYPPHVLIFNRQTHVELEHAYIISVDSANIYMADYNSAEMLWKIDSALLSITTIHLSNQESDKFLNSQTRLLIFDSSVFTIQQLRSIIFKYSLQRGGKMQTWMDSPYLSSTASVLLSSSSILLRTYYDPLGQNILAKKMKTSSHIMYDKPTLERQNDGIFSVDGSLLWNPLHQQIFYVYTYRNQFLCLDSNLELMYKANTLDTNTQAKISVRTLDNKFQTTMDSPPLTVNRLAAVSGDYLFINSAIKADNEVVNDFQKYSVIDVYHTNDGKYAFSFYVLKDRGNAISSMRALKNKLAIIQGQQLIVYTLSDALIH